MPLSIQIEKILSDGSGLGHRPDGKAVLVPFVLPGEHVEVEPSAESADFLTAGLLRVLDPSPDRRAAPCPHFGTCGGCDLQHAVYPSQLRIKKDILRESFGRLKSVEMPEISVLGSPTEMACRNTAVFHSASGRTGFFARASDRIVEPSVCPVLESGILERMKTLKPELRQDELRIRKDNLGQIVSSMDREKNNGFDFDGLKLRVWIRNFFQANTGLIPAWLDRIASLSGVRKDDEVLDLYSGVGIISHFLAKRSAKVTGIEADRASVKRAIINASLNPGGTTYFYAGPSERMIGRIRKADVVVLNPPRGGAEMGLLAPELVRLGPRTIVYSSCHPSTLVRDAGVLMSAGYPLRKLVLLDMFPQTRHFEVLAAFESRNI
jgi:tRNA/tmRNA/rRNA uracil-C5-methylase (TrmA/RlmC/RlmD family)